MIITRKIAEKHMNEITNRASDDGVFKMNGFNAGDFYAVHVINDYAVFLFVANGITATTANIYEADIIGLDWMETQGYRVER